MQVRVVSQLPRLDEMRSGEHRAEQKTKSTNNQVSNAEEVVLTADNRSCGYEDLLGAAILCDWKVCADSTLVWFLKMRAVWEHTIIDPHLIRSLSHGLVVTPKCQLAECRQPCGTEPHLEFLPFADVWDWEIFVVAVRISQCPVRRRHDLISRVWSLLV